MELVERALRNSRHPGNVVLDPFGGSGTILIATAGRRGWDSRPCARAMRLLSRRSLTTTDDNADHETDDRRDPDGLPGVFAYARIAVTGTGFAVFDESRLRLGQMDLQVS